MAPPFLSKIVCTATRILSIYCQQLLRKCCNICFRCRIISGNSKISGNLRIIKFEFAKQKTVAGFKGLEYIIPGKSIQLEVSYYVCKPLFAMLLKVLVLNLYIILNLCTDSIELPYSATSGKTWFFSDGIGIPNDLVKYIDRQFNMRGL